MGDTTQLHAAHEPEAMGIDFSERVPHELLAMIFDFGCILEVRPVQFKKPFPLVVSHVSTRWRNVALRTPTLWKDIFIKVKTATELVNTYLGRSQSCLLDIHLDLHYDIYDMYDMYDMYDTRAWTHRLECHVDRIVAHVGRWRRLTVIGKGRDSFLSLTSRLCDSYAPYLEDILIQWGASKDEHEFIDLCTNVFTGGAPCLSTLFMYELDMQLFQPPMTSITSFALVDHRISFEAFRHALIQMRCLEQLCIYVSFPELQRNPMSAQIELSSLISLELCRGAVPSQITDFLTTLHAPGLRSLLLNGFHDQDIVSLIDFFRRNPASRKYPSLCSLELRNTYLTPPDDVRLISCLPAITDFSLSSDFWPEPPQDTNLRSLLMETQEHNMRWPDLHSIILTSFNDVSIDTLRDVVAQRINRGGPISLLRIRRPLRCSLHTLGHLEWLKEHTKVVFLQNAEQVTSSSCSVRALQAFAYRRIR